MTSHDRPTPAERAAALQHDPLTCHICCNPHLHGDQAPDPLELETDRLRAEGARLGRENLAHLSEILRLKRERDWAVAEIARLGNVARAEREACAQLVEEISFSDVEERDHAHSYNPVVNGERTLRAIAVLIRARLTNP